MSGPPGVACGDHFGCVGSGAPERVVDRLIELCGGPVSWCVGLYLKCWVAVGAVELPRIGDPAVSGGLGD